MKIEKDRYAIEITFGKKLKIVLYKKSSIKRLWRFKVELSKRHGWLNIYFLRRELAFYKMRSKEQQIKALRKELIKTVKKLEAKDVEELNHYFTDKYINSIKVMQVK